MCCTSRLSWQEREEQYAAFNNMLRNPHKPGTDLVEPFGLFMLNPMVAILHLDQSDTESASA
ncbi:hypothetical protein BURKHO8Y_30102 [Burkholderia sp. 8Y]|nr:hypothetical protein BURKHO8Y_30102 [Burkholderia sp. 8Y]